MSKAKAEENARLVDVIKAVAEGRAGEEELRRALEAGRATLEDHRRSIQEVYEGLGPESQEAVADLMETAGEFFTILHDNLERVESYLETGDRNQLFIGGTQIDRATGQMNLLLLDFRNQALLAQGPTGIPTLNDLIALHQSFQEDPMEGFGAFRDAVQAERMLAVGNLQDLDHEPDLDEVHALRNAFDVHLRCMNRLAFALDDKDLDAIDDEMERCHKTFERVQELIPIATMALRGQGATAFPDINMILNLTRDLESAQTSDTLLLNALESLEENFGQTRESLMAMSGTESDSVLIKEELERALDALDGIEEAIEDYYEFFEVREILVLQSAADNLEASAVQLQSAFEAFQEIAEREGKVPCVRCAHFNMPDRTSCENCGASLPKKAGVVAASTFSTAEGPAANQHQPVVTPNLKKLYEAVNAVANEEISVDEFSEVVEWFANLIQTNAENAPPVPDEYPNDEQKRAVAEVYRLFDEGVDDMLKGADFFREYIQDGFRAQLESGVKEVDKGARKIDTVMTALTPPA